MGRLIIVLVSAVVLSTALVACGGSSSADTTTPPATSAPPQATDSATATPDGAGSDAAQVFAATCAGCHGADGGGGSAPSITGEDNQERIREQIRNGGDGMPAFSDTLTSEQIDALAQYVAGGLQ
jgi:cytochrome c551